MKVSDYIDFLVNGDCAKLAFSNVGDMSANPNPAPTSIQLVNQQKFIKFVNLANLALHKRYNLLKKTIELDLPENGQEYTLPSDFLVPIHAYYASDFVDISIKDSYTNVISKVDTAVSILIPEPFKAVIKGTDSHPDKLDHDQIILQYAAAPKKCTTPFTDLGISEVYTEPLLHYASYKAFSSISADVKDENNTYFLRYEASCKQLVTSGMYGNNEIEFNSKLEDRGFV